mmetsp:Transcript_80227/g.231758  ORF Transcript_80227/g.231758 Transcript_80227/m.231758 type:complete len:233 (-) Transcript_80227:236-934(-)
MARAHGRSQRSARPPGGTFVDGRTSPRRRQNTWTTCSTRRPCRCKVGWRQFCIPSGAGSNAAPSASPKRPPLHRADGRADRQARDARRVGGIGEPPVPPTPAAGEACAALGGARRELPHAHEEVRVVRVARRDMLPRVHGHGHRVEHREANDVPQDERAEGHRVLPEGDQASSIGVCLRHEEQELLDREDRLDIVRRRKAQDSIHAAPHVRDECDREYPWPNHARDDQPALR